MRLERLSPGRAPAGAMVGGILTRDIVVAGRRLAKGTRLTGAHLAAIAAARLGASVNVIVPDPWEVHEDDAALRLARAAGGGRPELALRGPVQSRVDLVAAAPGLVEVRVRALERLNGIDALEVFTVFDGQAVEPGELVASVKIAPHVIAEAVLLAGEAIARRGGPLVQVRAYRGVRLLVLSKGEVAPRTRQRFEAAIIAKAAGLRAQVGAIRYVADAVAPVTAALREVLADAGGTADAAGRGEDAPARTIVLTAGGASTDPADPIFTALETLGGRIVRRGVPAHPGSMLWLAEVDGTPVVGLPSCGAYSMATAADLLLARLAAGQPATAATVARLAHGGILARTQRFRFPAYARELDAPDG